MSFGEEKNTTDIEGNIEAISNRKNPVKVLMFLLKAEKLYYTTEIAKELDMNWFTVDANLYKLNDAGLIEIVENDVDKRLKLWKISTKAGSEKAIDLYKRKAGYGLARLVPYKKITTNELKSDKRFLESCEEHGLTISEGIQSVLGCPKILSEEHSGVTFLWRKEQGYDEEDSLREKPVEVGHKKPTEVEEIE
jgi:DNA-binding MarR family transcriptional regulator